MLSFRAIGLGSANPVDDRSKTVIGAISTALLMLVASDARAQALDPADYAHRLYYSIGVLQNCHGLSAFSLSQLDAAAARLGLSDNAVEAARRSGLNRADWQWGNRGLGGYRRWCAGEGALAADWAHRLSIDPSAAAPVMDDGLVTPR